MRAPTPQDRAKVAAARRAMIDSTPATTRPGSEHTRLSVGDRVRANREGARTGTWARYDGREGWVAAINHQTFPNGATYVEVGVSWTRPTNRRNPAVDVWFRTDELVPA